MLLIALLLRPAPLIWLTVRRTMTQIALALSYVAAILIVAFQQLRGQSNLPADGIGTIGKTVENISLFAVLLLAVRALWKRDTEQVDELRKISVQIREDVAKLREGITVIEVKFANLFAEVTDLREEVRTLKMRLESKGS